jgi:hypothetical protein
VIFSTKSKQLVGKVRKNYFNNLCEKIWKKKHFLKINRKNMKEDNKVKGSNGINDQI